MSDLVCIDHFLWPNGHRHGSASGGSDDIAQDVVFTAFKAKRLGETHDTSLGC
jgi:hypothetical protein